MATIRLVCRPSGGVVEAVDTDGLRYVWLEGVDVVERALAAWAERESVDGYTVAYDEGRGSYAGYDADCPVPPEGVALVELYTPAGARVQGVSFDKQEFPGGPGVFANYIVQGSTSLGGLAHWWERRKGDAARAADAVAGAVGGAVDAGRNAVGGALIATGDAVASLPGPREALNAVAETLGDAAGRVTAAFGVAAARGGASAVEAFWDELSPGGKVVASLAMLALVVVVVRKVST